MRDAVLDGATRRLRPILMTALATIFALMPMASGLTGHGGFISQPLAIVVIGGLVSSTVLTLIVLPTLYYLVEGRRERRDARRATPGPRDAGNGLARQGRRPRGRRREGRAAALRTGSGASERLRGGRSLLPAGADPAAAGPAVRVRLYHGGSARTVRGVHQAVDASHPTRSHGPLQTREPRAAP